MCIRDRRRLRWWLWWRNDRRWLRMQRWRRWLRCSLLTWLRLQRWWNVIRCTYATRHRFSSANELCSNEQLGSTSYRAKRCTTNRLSCSSDRGSKCIYRSEPSSCWWCPLIRDSTNVSSAVEVTMTSTVFYAPHARNPLSRVARRFSQSVVRSSKRSRSSTGHPFALTPLSPSQTGGTC